MRKGVQVKNKWLPYILGLFVMSLFASWMVNFIQSKASTYAEATLQYLYGSGATLPNWAVAKPPSETEISGAKLGEKLTPGAVYGIAPSNRAGSGGLLGQSGPWGSASDGSAETYGTDMPNQLADLIYWMGETGSRQTVKGSFNYTAGKSWADAMRKVGGFALQGVVYMMSIVEEINELVFSLVTKMDLFQYFKHTGGGIGTIETEINRAETGVGAGSPVEQVIRNMGAYLRTIHWVGYIVALGMLVIGVTGLILSRGRAQSSKSMLKRTLVSIIGVFSGFAILSATITFAAAIFPGFNPTAERDYMSLGEQEISGLILDTKGFILGNYAPLEQNVESSASEDDDASTPVEDEPEQNEMNEQLRIPLQLGTSGTSLIGHASVDASPSLSTVRDMNVAAGAIRSDDLEGQGASGGFTSTAEGAAGVAERIMNIQSRPSTKLIQGWMNGSSTPDSDIKVAYGENSIPATIYRLHYDSGKVQVSGKSSQEQVHTMDFVIPGRQVAWARYLIVFVRMFFVLLFILKMYGLVLNAMFDMWRIIFGRLPVVWAAGSLPAFVFILAAILVTFFQISIFNFALHLYASILKAPETIIEFITHNTSLQSLLGDVGYSASLDGTTTDMSILASALLTTGVAYLFYSMIVKLIRNVASSLGSISATLATKIGGISLMDPEGQGLQTAGKSMGAKDYTGQVIKDSAALGKSAAGIGMRTVGGGLKLATSPIGLAGGAVLGGKYLTNAVNTNDATYQNPIENASNNNSESNESVESQSSSETEKLSDMSSNTDSTQSSERESMGGLRQLSSNEALAGGYQNPVDSTQSLYNSYSESAAKAHQMGLASGSPAPRDVASRTAEMASFQQGLTQGDNARLMSSMVGAQSALSDYRSAVDSGVTGSALEAKADRVDQAMSSLQEATGIQGAGADWRGQEQRISQQLATGINESGGQILSNQAISQSTLEGAFGGDARAEGGMSEAGSVSEAGAMSESFESNAGSELRPLGGGTESRSVSEAGATSKSFESNAGSELRPLGGGSESRMSESFSQGIASSDASAEGLSSKAEAYGSMPAQSMSTSSLSEDAKTNVSNLSTSSNQSEASQTGGIAGAIDQVTSGIKSDMMERGEELAQEDNIVGKAASAVMSSLGDADPAWEGEQRGAQDAFRKPTRSGSFANKVASNLTNNTVMSGGDARPNFDGTGSSNQNRQDGMDAVRHLADPEKPGSETTGIDQPYSYEDRMSSDGYGRPDDPDRSPTLADKVADYEAKNGKIAGFDPVYSQGTINRSPLQTKRAKPMSKAPVTGGRAHSYKSNIDGLPKGQVPLPKRPKRPGS